MQGISAGVGLCTFDLSDEIVVVLFRILVQSERVILERYLVVCTCSIFRGL